MAEADGIRCTTLYPRLCFHVCLAGRHLIYMHRGDEAECEAFETRLRQGQVSCDQCHEATNV